MNSFCWLVFLFGDRDNPFLISHNLSTPFLGPAWPNYTQVFSEKLGTSPFEPILSQLVNLFGVPEPQCKMMETYED